MLNVAINDLPFRPLVRISTHSLSGVSHHPRVLVSSSGCGGRAGENFITFLSASKVPSRSHLRHVPLSRDTPPGV